MEPAVILFSKAVLNCNVPAPPAMPTVVTEAVVGSRRTFPVVVTVELKVGVASLCKVKLFAPNACAPEIVMTPVPEINDNGVVQVRAATVIAAESATLPIVIEPAVILFNIAVPIFNVPAPPATPTVVEAVEGAIVTLPVVVTVEVNVGVTLVNKVKLLAPIACAPEMVTAPAPVINESALVHV